MPPHSNSLCSRERKSSYPHTNPRPRIRSFQINPGQPLRLGPTVREVLREGGVLQFYRGGFPEIVGAKLSRSELTIRVRGAPGFTGRRSEWARRLAPMCIRQEHNGTGLQWPKHPAHCHPAPIVLKWKATFASAAGQGLHQQPDKASQSA